MENILRRDENSWLCVKFEFVFFAGHGILIRVLPPSCLAFTVNESASFVNESGLTLIMWCHALCCAFFVLNFCYIMWFHTFVPLRDILMRFHNFWPQWDVLMRFPALCCITFLWDLLMRFHIFCHCKIFLRDVMLFRCIIISFNFMFFGCYEISLWDVMVCEPQEISSDFLLIFHAFWPHDEIYLWDVFLFAT